MAIFNSYVKLPEGKLLLLDFLEGFWKFISGWWLTYPSEKYEFVSWDDDSQYMEK